MDHHAQDEAFWRRQEKRRERGLGQPCCTQSGMSWTLIDMPGNFAVVIHGEFDCVNCFSHHTGRSALRYYSTRLTDRQLTLGETAAPLRRCLQLIAAEERPDAVIVLGTCPVEVIGDQFHEVVEEVSAETGVPMVALRTSGLKLSSQREMLDWCFDTLVSLSDVQVDEDAVCFLGMPSGGPMSEGRRALESSGVRFRGSFPEGASMDDWRAMGRSRHCFASDLAMFPKLVKRLEDRGQRVIETPMPFGLRASEAFYRVIDQALGERDILAGLRSELTAAQDAVAEFRAAYTGKRLGLTLRMRNTYRSDVIAQDGLGQLDAFLELGFDVTLLIQGAPDPDVVDATAALLAARGVALPFQMFPGPFQLREFLEAGRYDLACVADHGLQAARLAGTPAIDTVAMQPFLGAVPRNLARIRALLEQS